VVEVAKVVGGTYAGVDGEVDEIEIGTEELVCTGAVDDDAVALLLVDGTGGRYAGTDSVDDDIRAVVDVWKVLD
jgi:hypothetical protein